MVSQFRMASICTIGCIIVLVYGWLETRLWFIVSYKREWEYWVISPDPHLTRFYFDCCYLLQVLSELRQHSHAYSHNSFACSADPSSKGCPKRRYPGPKNRVLNNGINDGLNMPQLWYESEQAHLRTPSLPINNKKGAPVTARFYSDHGENNKWMPKITHQKK